jgi:hypothetical protein
MAVRAALTAFCCAALLAQSALAAEEPAKPATEETPPPAPNAIVLQGLNKVTGRISRFDGLLGTVLRFGNLEIVPRRCWQSAPEERPEHAALIEITELRQGEPPKAVFTGWMFASSPGLSTLEHPVYDIAVISCEQRALSEDEPDSKEKKPQP